MCRRASNGDKWKSFDCESAARFVNANKREEDDAGEA